MVPESAFKELPQFYLLKKLSLMVTELIVSVFIR